MWCGATGQLAGPAHLQPVFTHSPQLHVGTLCSPEYAQRFMDTLPNARLVWVEECGHCAHLEQPQALLQAMADFVGAQEAAVAAS